MTLFNRYILSPIRITANRVGNGLFSQPTAVPAPQKDTPQIAFDPGHAISGIGHAPVPIFLKRTPTLSRTGL